MLSIVPYGHMWRTGANEATMFVVTDDVLINGQKLAAGSYSLHTIPDQRRVDHRLQRHRESVGQFQLRSSERHVARESEAAVVSTRIRNGWRSLSIRLAKTQRR